MLLNTNAALEVFERKFLLKTCGSVKVDDNFLLKTTNSVERYQLMRKRNVQKKVLRQAGILQMGGLVHFSQSVNLPHQRKDNLIFRQFLMAFFKLLTYKHFCREVQTSLWPKRLFWSALLILLSLNKKKLFQFHCTSVWQRYSSQYSYLKN